MTVDIRQKNIEWMTEQLNQKLREVAALKAELDDIKGEIAIREKTLADFKGILDLVVKSSILERNTSQSEVTNQSDNDDEEDDKEASKLQRRTEHAGLTLKEAIQKILSDSLDPLDREKIALELYESETQEELKHAKNSLSPVLSRGIKDGLWVRTDRGLYKLPDIFENELTAEEDTEIFDS